MSKKKIIVDTIDIQKVQDATTEGKSEPTGETDIQQATAGKAEQIAEAVKQLEEAAKTEAVDVQAENKAEQNLQTEAQETVDKGSVDKMPETETKEKQSNSRPHNRKSHIKWWIIGGIAGVVLVLAAIFYGSMAIHYQTCFLPGTYINGLDCRELKVPQVAALLEKQSVGDYALEILGKAEDGTTQVVGRIDGADIDLGLKDGLLGVQEIFDKQNPMLWIETVGDREVTHTMSTEIQFSEDKLSSLLAEMDFAGQEGEQVPRDAYLSDYSEEIGGYEIIPEVQSSILDMEKVRQVVAKAIAAGTEQVDLVALECYQEPKITAKDPQLKELRDTLNLWLSTVITYDWVGNQVILDKDTLKDWITVEEGAAVLDEEKVAAFVASNARKYDNYGANRDFVTSLGVSLNLPSGAFGWRTNRDKETETLIELIKAGTRGKREPEYSSKAPRKDGNNIGSSYVEIDLTNQHLYLYKDGVLVLESLFVSGKMTDSECVTPQGVFRITYKTVNATLRGGDYAEFVYYWMPFHGNYGMHDATWRTEFGGDIYLTDGSHGCINLPLENAEVIYNYMYAGYPVICYYYY